MASRSKEPDKGSSTESGLNPASKTGPKPDVVKIEGDWEDAVDTALKKKRPVEGWPKSERPKQ